jgi:hypothetical protein
VEREFLDKAKRQNKVLNFSYTVTDQLLNGPDPDAVWSAAVAVDEDLDGTLLDKPILREIADDTTDDPGIIDLKKLGINPLLLFVSTADPRFEPGDKIEATYTAKIPGQDDRVRFVIGEVETDPIGNKVTCILKVENEYLIVASSVTVTYELRNLDGDLVGSSNTAKATVTGSAPIELLPPFLVAPAVEPIDVLAYPNGVTVRIKYLEALSGDRARLVEVNQPAGSPQFPLVEFNSDKQVDTVLSAAFLAARHGKENGKEIELRWNLNRNNAQIGKSSVLPLAVLKIADGDARLPEPGIQESNNTDKLDVNSFKGNATFELSRWDFSEARQSISATLSSDTGTPLTIAKNVAITHEESIVGVKKSISRDWLNTIPNGAEVYLETAITPRSVENSTPVIFLKKRYTITNKPLPLKEDFEATPTQIITQGQKIELPSMTITLISGSGSAGIAPVRNNAGGFPVSGVVEGNVLHMCYSESGGAQHLRIDFKSTHSIVHFGLAWANTETSVITYNSKYQVIEQRIMDHKDIVRSFPGPDISRIEIKTPSMDWIGMDFFTLE